MRGNIRSLFLFFHEIMSYYSQLKCHFIVHVLGPLFFVAVSPSVVLLLWYTIKFHDGSLVSMYYECRHTGFWNILFFIWSNLWNGSSIAWCIIAAFATFQLILMRLVPGAVVEGARTPAGFVPQYTDNGIYCFLITLSVYFLLTYRFQLLQPYMLYKHFGELLGALSLLSFSFCIFLYVKGIFFPTSKRPDHSKSPLFDFYWGTELHPRILGWDVKQFTNCRFGMMSWGFIILCFAHAQYEIHGYLSNSMFISVMLQMVYIFKFYWWEAGYLKSLDIMHDRAGFYICWGCMVWVPGFYTLTTQYLVMHPVSWEYPLSIMLLTAGVMFICLNFDADRQRQLARSTHGDCIIWGKPAEYIVANYTDNEDVKHESILLTSGWWGLSRHFHYIPEVLAAFCWSVTAQFQNILPYFYVIFLTLLLIERAFRDDVRCREKYGKFWTQYCEKVKYLIIPGLL